MAIPEEEEVTEVLHPSDRATDSVAYVTDTPADGSVSGKEADPDQKSEDHADKTYQFQNIIYGVSAVSKYQKTRNTIIVEGNIPYTLL